ncbi:MAG TPA: hypothetical protein PLO24_05995, partial [Bacteroidales bacterium]|nr:hypothetical protein [Bacteroidales bacterium]
MKRIKITSLITLFFLLCISCSDEWLKPDPLSFFAPENIYVDAAGFEAGLVRCRKEMNAENHGYQNPIAVDVMYTDIAVPLRQSDFTQNTPSLVQQVPLVLTIFSSFYGYIKNANTIIS